MRYYDISNIRSKDCDYNFIVSGRGPGKSTSCVNMLIDEYYNNGKEFVRVTRYDFEASPSIMLMWFNDINLDRVRSYYGEDAYMDYRRGEWLVCTEKGKRRIGRCISLNNQDIYKSVSYDQVTNIVFEEFVQMSERDYVKGEIELFLSAISTIVRSRDDCKVWMIGNTLSKYNPYFDFFGIDIDRLGIYPGTIKTYRCSGFDGMGSTVAIEYAEMSYESIIEIPSILRIGGNITATSGLYMQDPSVSEFKARTCKILDDEYTSFMRFADYVYLGNDDFATVRVTKYPKYDNMRLLRISKYDPDISDLMDKSYLNLSGEFNPRCSVYGNFINIKSISPYYIFSDDILRRRIRLMDYRCVHAYESDEIRRKWINFVDGYDYKGDHV